MNMEQFTRLFGFIAAIGLIVWGFSGVGTRETARDHQALVRPAAHPANPNSASADRSKYTAVQIPIADIRVGTRVSAYNPDVTSTERAKFQDPDPATWRTLVLELPKAAGGVLEITMLRPLEWLEAHQAQVGRSIHLDMPELGATGQAKVLGIYPCPAIQEGPGQVVTATFAHPATHQILNVTIGAGPDAETIGVTETHPFWSVTHNAFVPIGQLSVGDEVLTLHGQTKRIETLLPRPGPAEKVYNLEVHGEHTYFVGQQQLLVHNNYPKDIGLGLSGHLDELEAAGKTTWRNSRFFEIAENGRPQFTGSSGPAVQWQYIREAINNADSITFNLRGMSPEHFGRFVKGGVNILRDVPADKNFTNGELLYLLTTNKNVTFINGNISDFLVFLK